MRALFIFFFVWLYSYTCFSQADATIMDVRNIYDEKGDYYFEKKDYKKAIVYYNMAYKKDPGNYYSVLRKAEAYAKMDSYDQAAECYRIIFNTSLRITNEYRLQYALLLLKNKDIAGFEEWMRKYNAIVQEEIYHYVSSTEVRAKMYKDSSMIIVENESALNTAESEIAPMIYRNKVVFSSTRKNLTGTSGPGVYDVFSASYGEAGRLGRLNRFNAGINSSLNESSVFFSEAANNMYFTRSTTPNTKLKTYISNIPATVIDAVNIREFTLEGFSSIGHVAFNSDGTKLYFVSEAPGGSGGLDIYSSTLVVNRWSKPINLGASINSPKDEMYPFVLNDTVLYFSSNGHGGLGGFDLYSVNLKKPGSKPQNLGSIVNSPYDDYALSFSPGGLTGYFCSNRPGGFGKEDIYRVHLLDLKIKLAAYKFRKKPTIEEGKINLYLSNGDEYNIISKDKMGFDFTFEPQEAYKMIIQHENVLATDVIENSKLNADQRAKEMLNPKPLERSEVKLQPGQKYQFTAGMKPITADFKAALNEMAKNYKNPSSANTIDLTALAKELQLTQGEIYTIQFVKDDNLPSSAKSKAESNLLINNVPVAVAGRSFFIVLPLDIQTNFNIATDIDHFKEKFNPGKVGAVKVDATPVYREETKRASEGFPILVNTETFTEIASDKKVTATELTIIPGTMYILTFGKAGSKPEDQIVVPLTKGVKYNLGTAGQSQAEYNRAIAQLAASQPASSNEELIDISVLSKELNMQQDDIVFNLIPARQISTQAADPKNVLTTLSVDGRKYFVTNKVKLQVNLKLEQNKKVNIQTDLAYVKDNFDPSTIALKVDTTSVRTSLAKGKTVITDPVFDVIVVNFNLNEYSIRADAKTILENKVINVLKNDSRLYVTIKGYTDPLGNAAYNEKLSENRALSVKDFLAKNGIGENRIRTFSFGASQALEAGQKWEDLSEAELQKHRKVEIVIYLPK